MKKNPTKPEFSYGIDTHLFDKKPYVDLLRAYKELFPITKPCLRLLNNVFVYNKAIKILFTNKIIARNRLTLKDEEIENKYLFIAYEDGFKQGEIYFDQNYKVSTDTIFSAQFKYIERNFHNMYFHSEVNGGEDGWRKYIVCFPFIISYDEIYKYGYYAGLVHSLEQLKATYPAIFVNFDKCNNTQVHIDQVGSKPEVDTVKTNEVLNPVQELPTDLPEKLIQLFDSVSKYHAIMQILVEKGYVAEISHIWKDSTGGNKSFLASLIKTLHHKGYYKENIKPSNEQIMLICKSSFGSDVSIDTIKKANPNKFNFNFIPPAEN